MGNQTPKNHHHLSSNPHLAGPEKAPKPAAAEALGSWGKRNPARMPFVGWLAWVGLQLPLAASCTNVTAWVIGWDVLG